jgi:cation diffusion facilitator family transporter
LREIFSLLKKGSKSALLAACVNLLLGTIKAVAFFFTGNVAMFAEMMHSFGDAANQFFVYFGSALSKKVPTKKFPDGFGRLVNLVCLGAVLIVGILSYETIKEGWHHLMHPSAESNGMWIALSVLAFGIILEAFVLFKASKEVLEEAGQHPVGVRSIFKAPHYLNRAKPATKLVWMEDLVATAGNVLAFTAIVIANLTGWFALEGLISIVIGIMMFGVVTKVFLDNAKGVIGETDEEMLVHIAHLVQENKDIVDIKDLKVVKEGEYLHVELLAETDHTHSLAYLNDVKKHLTEIIMSQRAVNKVIIMFDEDDGIVNWGRQK